MKSILFAIFSLASLYVSAQLNPQPIQIPMRDGKSLSADLYLPSGQSQYPVILIQTPYNKNTFRFFLPLGVGQNIDDSPYAFVVLDWRCFYGSTLACDPGGPSRGEDGYDAVEWIAAQSWCNGKVGTWGLSALGVVQFQTAREKPPHLVCAVPMVASPQTRYHQYFPGGVALPEFLETLNSLFNGAFTLIAQNPYYNFVWQLAESTTFYPEEIEIPMLHIGGWFDHNTEDNFIWFNAMRDVSPAADKQWLLMGPWTHGGFGSAMQGELSFPQAMQTHNEVANAFFLHYLLDEDNGWESTPRVMYFQMGDNVWLEDETFPPVEGITMSQFYLRDDMSLSLENGLSAQSASFQYDPNDSSPTIGGKTLSDELPQGPYDQSIDVESRNDNLIFTTPVLTEDIVLKGQVKVHLFVSSDRPDTDIALRLTEVYPDGRSMALGQISQRMRFRSGYTMADESFMQPGQMYEIAMTFDQLANTFKAGNRIRLIITSSNYPWFNRNANTDGEMYPSNNLDTLVNPLIARNMIHMQGAFPSRIILPVAQAPSALHYVTPAAFTIVPNPAHESVILKNVSPGAVAFVYDMTGIEVERFIIHDHQQLFSVQHLNTGMYILKISDHGFKTTQKLLVLNE